VELRKKTAMGSKRKWGEKKRKEEFTIFLLSFH